MRSSSIAFVLLAGAGLLACALPQRRHFHTSRHVWLADAPPAVTVQPSGEIVVRLPRCAVRVREVYSDTTDVTAEPCVEPLAGVSLTTPWGRTLRAPVSLPDADGHGFAVFSPDFRDAPVDPLDQRTWPRGKPWRVNQPLLETAYEWLPTEAELEVLSRGMGGKVGIDGSAAPVGVPPELVVDSLVASNDEILAGGPTTIEVTVTNRGEGTAYRVFATTRSSVAELQGLQFSMGRIEPRATVARRVRLELPESVAETTAMLVLVFSEANGFAPANFSRRFPLRIVATAPRLGLGCVTAGGVRVVDAGESLRLRCTIRNEGGRLASRVATLAVIGTGRVAAMPVDIAARGEVVVELPVRIPTDAAIDQEVPIEITATETGGQRAAATVMVTIRRPRVCPTGKLTRAEYRLKRTELERARAAGDLTADEFDRYDAELVGCLNE